MTVEKALISYAHSSADQNGDADIIFEQEGFGDVMDTSKNMQYLRIHNRGDVIRMLALNRAVNRSELALRLKLSKMAVGNIIAELIDSSIVEEYFPEEEKSRSNGRRARNLRIRPWSIASVCVWVSRGSVWVMLMDIAGNVMPEKCIVMPDNCKNNLLAELIGNGIAGVMEEHKDINIMGIGVASIGPLDIYNGIILNPPNFGKIRNVNLLGSLKRRFELPVYMDNDMNCSALAEVFYGSGRNCRDIVFVGFKYGVGAGVIMNEKVLHGSGGFAGEVGHISINPRGPLCACGQYGCIEMYTSGDNVLRNVGVADIHELHQLLDSDHVPEYVLRCLEEYKEAMQTLTTLLVNTYDPEVVIFESGNESLHHRYINEIEEYMNEHMLSHGYKHIKVIDGSLEKPALYGAGYLVFQHLMNGTL